IIPVTIVYFCYGWILWLFLSWIPSFFKGQYKLDLKSSALFASGVFFSGVVGDTVGGIISDKLFERTHNPRVARCNMVAVMMLLCGMSLAPIDRKSTRLNSSHGSISYAACCFQKDSHPMGRATTHGRAGNRHGRIAHSSHQDFTRVASHAILCSLLGASGAPRALLTLTRIGHN